MVAIANIRGQLLTKINQEPNKNKMLKQNSYQTSPRNKVWGSGDFRLQPNMQPLTPHVHTVLGPEQPLADSNFNRAFSGTSLCTCLICISPSVWPFPSRVSQMSFPIIHSLPKTSWLIGMEDRTALCVELKSVCPSLTSFPSFSSECSIDFSVTLVPVMSHNHSTSVLLKCQRPCLWH